MSLHLFSSIWGAWFSFFHSFTLSWCMTLRFWKCTCLLIILSSAVPKSAINCEARRMLGTTIISIIQLLTHSNKFLVIPKARVCNYQLLMRSSVHLWQLTTQGIQLWPYMLCSLSMEMSKANWINAWKEVGTVILVVMDVYQRDGKA